MNTKPNEELRNKLQSLSQVPSHYCNCDGCRNHRVFTTDDLLQLIQTEIAEAERRAVLKELKAIWNETQHDILPVGLEPVEYTASVVLRRIKQLTEIEVPGEGEK